MKVLPILLMAACAAVMPLKAAEPAEAVDELSMTLEENITYPQVSAKRAQAVRSAMGELRRKLAAKGFKADTERNDEVVSIVIPASELFRANACELSPEGRKKLNALKEYVNHREQFKVLVAVHADDTGDEEYSEQLTADRANAIDDYFCDQAGHELNIIPYGIGHDEPLANDATMKNRALNRRVEIFFVPTVAYLKYLGQK